MKKAIFFLLQLYFFVIGFSADSDSTIFISNLSKNKNALVFSNCYNNSRYENLPTFNYQLNDNKTTVEIVNPIFEIIDYNFTKKQLDIINSTLEINKNKANINKREISKIEILPFIKDGNTIKYLKNFNLKIVSNLDNIPNNNRQSTTNLSYVNHSVLQNGNWYKFSVNKTGIYKLDYNFLKQLGIAVDAIQPNNIKIFGHDAGMLPELAGAMHTDDLKEIAIKMVVTNPNQFGVNDYILLYAPGPEKWYFDNAKQIFKKQNHLYSNTKSFFITVDVGLGNRIMNDGNVNTAENISTDKYDDYFCIEDDKENLGLSGRNFVGDVFGGTTEKTYNFQFPNISSSDVAKINYGVLSDSKSGNSVFTLYQNNNNFRTTYIAPLTQILQDIYNIANYKEEVIAVNNLSNNIDIKVNFQRPDFTSKGWIDFININVKSNLKFNGTPFNFRNISTVGTGNITKFTIDNVTGNTQIWDVTDVFNPIKINLFLNGNIGFFRINTDILREFVIFENVTNLPIANGKIDNQDLHALTPQDLIIVTRNKFLQQAEQLAQLHRENENLRAIVVDYDKILNEFSSGTNDISAIRNFVKMLYDKASNNNDLPKYLMLFGDGTFNNKNMGDYLLPTYQSNASFEYLDTYVSDDYFGLLDDNEGSNLNNTNTELLDIGVGRIPADDITKAQVAVDKIKNYYNKSAFGDWRNQATFIADDEDYNLHIEHADIIAQNFANTQKDFNIDKIYLDAYAQQSGAGGAKYPQVNDAISKKIFTGSLFVNYSGHGGSEGLAQERIITLADISNYDNANKMPLFITATCEFSRYDEYDKYTAGERLFFKENGGAIALVTTTRVVFEHQNREINTNFTNALITASNNQNMLLGDILKIAKNNTTSTGVGNRKFALLGDPALRLAFPKMDVVCTSLNNIPIVQPHDTIKSLSKITIKGEVQKNSILQNNFNGLIDIIIYDKSKTINTLQNDPQSFSFPFQLQKNIIFKGKTNVQNGVFEITFLTPKDIDFDFGNGKISMYAYNDTTDANGFTNDIIIGGIYDTIITDNKGPKVDIFMNDEKFAFGGITDGNPTMLVNLFDENGINISGNGIGHDITAIIDNKINTMLTLNDFYQTELNNISKGKLKYPFKSLAKGKHTLEIKAWDILNNSGKGYTEFIVEDDAKLALNHVLNYPNPFTTSTTFMFEHNKPDQLLNIKIEIFTVSGKIVKTITQNSNAIGYRVNDIKWDGKDDFGSKIGKGVYIYRITVNDESGKKTSQYQKLVILN